VDGAKRRLRGAASIGSLAPRSKARYSPASFG